MFSTEPKTSERSLFPDEAQGALQSLRDLRIERRNGVLRVGPPSEFPEGLPPVSWPEAGARIRLRLRQRQAGTLTLEGGSDSGRPITASKAISSW